MALPVSSSGRTFLRRSVHAARYEWLIVCVIGFLSLCCSSTNASMIPYPSNAGSNEALSKSLLSNDWLFPWRVGQDEFANSGWHSGESSSSGSSSNTVLNPAESDDQFPPESLQLLDAIHTPSTGGGAGAPPPSSGSGTWIQVATANSRFELPIPIVLSWLSIEKSPQIPSGPSFELFRPPRPFTLLG